MEELRYEAPDTLDAAVALLAGAGGDARVLSGGTDLLVQLRDLHQPLDAVGQVCQVHRSA
jgi:carbon-monoxide dehydrogenase medium subunit